MSRDVWVPSGFVLFPHEPVDVKSAVADVNVVNAAGLTDDSPSNNPNAPPSERLRAETSRPGMPRPRMPNCDDWAATVLTITTPNAAESPGIRRMVSSPGKRKVGDT